MAPPEDLERVKLEEETKRLGFKYDLRKVIYGTMIVGLAAAVFPFAQKWAELTFSSQIEQARQKVQVVNERRVYLERLALEGRSNDIETRIRLAEFYSFLAGSDDGEKANWFDFREYLIGKQKELNAKKLELLRKCQTKEDDPECLSVQEELRLIEKYTDPSAQSTENIAPQCNYTKGAPALAGPITSEHLLPGVSFCQRPGEKRGKITPSFIVIHSTEGASFENDLRFLMSTGILSYNPGTHVLVGKDGTSVQMAPFDERVIHVGRGLLGDKLVTNANSIGVHMTHQGEETFPPEQVATVAAIVKKLQERYGIAKEQVVRHGDLLNPQTKKPTRDEPGPQFPWDDFLQSLE